jgi:NAD(P)-dependent dehydrogenase (short-subunit alcohol dehydrogenase family)
MRNTVIITGAGSGIGRELCRYFAERGWAIGAADISYARAQKTVAEISTLTPHKRSPQLKALFRKYLHGGANERAV